MRRLIAGAVLLPAVATGQTVRGSVTHRGSSAPALGAIVTLERVSRVGEPGLEVHSVLVDERGTFSLRATPGTTLAIVVRRIGLRPFRSDTMTLAPGETRRLEIALDAINPGVENAFTLERVTVSGATPCRTANDQSVRIAELWDNAQTALLATVISTRDSLVRRRLIRYERSRDPATLAIQSENVCAFDAMGGTTGGFFRSLPGDSLSKVGYWQRIGTGIARFHGPDENAILSPTFLADHCFTVVAPAPGGEDLVGLGFEPAEHRRQGDAPPEIRGTIWLDRLTSELRTLEFTWTTLPAGIPELALGGHVRYSRLSWGPWFVQDWWLRMPEGLPSDRTASSRFGILEEGGLVQAADAALLGAKPATISGTIRDAASRPLAEAAISIAGTSLRTVSDAEGRFTIDSVPPGLQVVVADHPRYDALGVRAAEENLLLDAGSERALILDAPSDAQIPERLCGAPLEAGHGTLRLIVLEAVTLVPVPGMRVTLADRKAKVSGSGFFTQAETDSRGAALFCSAPAERLLEVTATTTDKRATTFELALPASGMKVRVVHLVRR